MGTYLMTGLKMQVSAYCSEPETQKPDTTEFPEDVYDFSTQEDTITYKIREDVLRQELLPFLREFYHVYYGTDGRYYQKALDFLETHAYEEWDAFFEKGGEYECSFESIDTLVYVDENWANADTVLIRLAFEGKVMVEEMDAHLSLYNHALKRAFSSKLSGALHTQIVG